MTPIPYTDELETILPTEGATIQGIITAMEGESRTVADRDGETVRASHAKSTGLLTGEMQVLDGLPETLRQGLFAQSARYPVLMRLAQGPGERLSDGVSTHRGMAIKVLGVQGPKLDNHTGATQDFVLATGTAFAQADAGSFLTAIKGIEKATALPEAVKQAVSSTSRVAEAALEAAGGSSPTLGFFGHAKRSPLADAYFSQAALRWGGYVAKIGVFPVSPALIAAIDRMLDTSADPDAFRTAVVSYMRANAAEFELRVQLCTDASRMPVEDASVPWPEDASPYVPVARITLPPQEAHSPARAAYFDGVLSFRPGHSLQAHRPLGSVMRARLATYPALSNYRHQQTGVREREPTSMDEVPA